MRSLVFLSLVALLAVPCWVVADGDAAKKSAKRDGANTDSASESKTTTRAKRAAKPTVSITKEQEAVAKSFVKQNHNDLFELLIHLKEGLPNEYSRAIRDLSRASERLAAIEKRDVARYELELKLWKAQSRRQLITAKLQMAVDDSLLEELRDTLREEQKLGVAILRHERERFASRVEKLDEQLLAQESDLEAAVEKRFTSLTRSVKNSQRSVSTKSRKAPAKNQSKDPT